MSEGSKFFAKEVYNKGDELDENFLKHSFTTSERNMYTPLRQNYFKFFFVKYAFTSSNTEKKLSSLKQKCNLYASFYVSCQKRGCDCHDFFSHQNHIYPPSFQSIQNRLRCFLNTTVKNFTRLFPTIFAMMK